jgi:hypothetical protein
MDREEIRATARRLPFTENFKTFMLVTAGGPPSPVVNTARINLQAQCVLIAINSKFGIGHLSKWTQFLPKHNGNGG